MSFLKKLFKKDDTGEQRYYEDRNDYIDESYEYYDEQQADPEYQAYDTPEMPVTKQQPPQQPVLEDVYTDVYDAPETQSPFFQEQTMPVQEPVYHKPPADYSPFGQQPQGLIRTVQRVSRERYNPFTETGVAPEIRKPRVQHVAPVEPPQPKPKFQPQFEQKKQDPIKPPVKAAHELYVAPKQTFGEEAPAKKKFEPMNVPSPIYGFQEPPKRPIVTVEHVEAQRELVRTLNDKKPIEIKSSEEMLKKVELRHEEEQPPLDLAEPISKDVENITLVTSARKEQVVEIVEQEQPTTTMVQEPIAEASQQTLEQAIALMDQGIEQPVTHGQAPSIEQALVEELTVAEREVEEASIVEDIEAIKELAEVIEEIEPNRQAEAVIEEAAEVLAEEQVPEAFLTHVEKARPFNVVLLPSEKKKMQQPEKAAELKKLLPTSPLRPTITVNSYKKEDPISNHEVYPSTIERIVDRKSVV